MCGRRDCSASAQPGGHGLRTMIPARSGVRTRAFRLAARRTKLTRAADPVLPKASFHARRDGNRAWQQARERSRRRWRNWRHRRRDRRDGRGNGHDTRTLRTSRIHGRRAARATFAGERWSPEHSQRRPWAQPGDIAEFDVSAAALWCRVNASQLLSLSVESGAGDGNRTHVISLGS